MVEVEVVWEMGWVVEVRMEAVWMDGMRMEAVQVFVGTLVLSIE